MDTAMLSAESPEVQAFLVAWHENWRWSAPPYAGSPSYDECRAKRAKDRKKYIALDVDTSGMFLVDRVVGTVHSIKAYGVPNRALGHLVDLTRAFESALKPLPIPGSLDADATLQGAALLAFANRPDGTR